jgi:hypothetical protein
MKVRAKLMGYYDHKRRRLGEVFHIQDEKEFSKKWMVTIDSSNAPKGKKSDKKSKESDEDETQSHAHDDSDVI